MDAAKSEMEPQMTDMTERFNRSLCLTDEDAEKYRRYRQEGKDAAQRGDLERSLELFRLAYELRPCAKLKSRIQRLQEAIQELATSQPEEEDEEFVNVKDSGLMLYKELYDKLYEHQKEGVAFLYSLHRDGRKGGILADDMGLGKTIQVISFLSGMYDAELANHTLLVMPTSLIKNWVREFGKWTPGMRVKEFHGSSKAERNRNLERIQRKGGAVITTYQMLINNWEQLASFQQREFCWDYVILDEAHKIKTSSTKTAKCAHAIPARHRMLLTGTPVQNNLREMWALFDFACQGSLLGTAKTFKTEYENPITRAREKDATPGEKVLGLKISQNLMELIRPYFLRRTKAEVQQRKQERAGRQEPDQENKCPNAEKFAEMPSLTRKNDLIVWTYLSPVQEDIYNQFISLEHIKELLMTSRSPLAELTVLKKLCDHPRLLSSRAVTQLGLQTGTAANPAPEEDESESMASLIDHIPDHTLIDESGKLRFLVSLLERLREEGHRTLIFSQSRKMLDIMERVLRNRDFRLVRVDGTVTQLAEREKRIALFQTDRRYSVFLLTTQVGGVGITLTAANRVVIFDPSWNPATDAQAVDRAYRIGQMENVIIYRLITCGTVEEKIYRRQVFKDSLIRQTTGDKKNPFRYFSKQELKELFTLEDTRSSSTQLQLQGLHAQQRRSDPGLDRHIAHLHTMDMFGVSDHDLLFSKEAAADEEAAEDAESRRYIETRVQKAQELVQAESELQGQLMESVAHSTEPAWIRLARQRGEEEPPKRERRKPPPAASSPPAVVDLTQSGSDQFAQSDDGSSHAEEVNEGVCVEAADESELAIVDLTQSGLNQFAQSDDSLSHANEVSAGGCAEAGDESEMPVAEVDLIQSSSDQFAQSNDSLSHANEVSEGGCAEAGDESEMPVGGVDLIQSSSDQFAQSNDSLSHANEVSEGGCAEAGDESEMPVAEMDLIQSSSDQFAQSDNSLSHANEVSEGGGMMATDESVLAMDVSVQSVKVSAAETSTNDSHVITVEDSCNQDSELSSPSRVEVQSVQHEDSPTSLGQNAHTHSRLSLCPALSRTHTPTSLLRAQQDASDISVEAEPFQGNFNLKLEDSADMFSNEEDEGEEEMEEAAGEAGFQLQMDVSGERLDDVSNLDKKEMSNCDFPVRWLSALSTSAEESPLHFGRKKKKAQVLYDTEEEEEEEDKEVERPSLASSPLERAAKDLICSTPNSVLKKSASRRRSLNVSVASRRSFVESLLEELEEEAEDSSAGAGEDEDEEVVLSRASEANGVSADESVVEEEEPSGETLSSENMSEGESREHYETAEEEEEEGEEEQSSLE